MLDDAIPTIPPNSVRTAGYAAYADRARDQDVYGEIDVVDLVFDSLVDTANGVSDEIRRLRFVGQTCRVDVDVRGYQRRTATVRVWPAGPVVVESCAPGGRGRSPLVQSLGQLTMTWSRPQLTSFFLRWPGSDRRPVRTAWVIL
jgi:hypothetical protein